MIFLKKISRVTDTFFFDNNNNLHFQRFVGFSRISGSKTTAVSGLPGFFYIRCLFHYSELIRSFDFLKAVVIRLSSPWIQLCTRHSLHDLSKHKSWADLIKHLQGSIYTPNYQILKSNWHFCRKKSYLTLYWHPSLLLFALLTPWYGISIFRGKPLMHYHCFSQF